MLTEMANWEDAWRAEMGLPPRLEADPMMTEAREVARSEGLDAPSAELGSVLRLLAGAGGVRRILQLGTGSGYSTVSLARGAPTAAVLTVDVAGRDQLATDRLFVQAGIADRISRCEGSPIDVLLDLEGRFDLIHIDVDPLEHRRMLDYALMKLEVGGTVSIDGVAPRGVAEGEALASPFCGYFLIHPQLESVILPLSRGLAVGRKIKSLVTDEGGPL